MICYLSHPLGCENGNETVQRQDNIYNSGKWFHWLMEGTGWAVNAPWYAYVTFLPRELRPMAFVSQLRILRTCNIAAFTGIWSPHMNMEKTVCERHNIPMLDLTDLGRFPPTMEKHEIRALVKERVEKLGLTFPG